MTCHERSRTRFRKRASLLRAISLKVNENISRSSNDSFKQKSLFSSEAQSSYLNENEIKQLSQRYQQSSRTISISHIRFKRKSSYVIVRSRKIEILIRSQNSLIT